MTKLINGILLVLIFIFYIFEEIAWKRLGLPVYNRVAQLKIMDRFRTFISDVSNRHIVLFIFLIPFGLMELSAYYAGIALYNGMIFSGIGLYCIKLLLTAPVVIIFTEAKTILVSFIGIKYSYGILLRLQRSKLYRRVKRYMSALRQIGVPLAEDILNTPDSDLTIKIKALYREVKTIKL